MFSLLSNNPLMRCPSESSLLSASRSDKKAKEDEGECEIALSDKNKSATTDCLVEREPALLFFDENAEVDDSDFIDYPGTEGKMVLKKSDNLFLKYFVNENYDNDPQSLLRTFYYLSGPHHKCVKLQYRSHSILFENALKQLGILQNDEQKQRSSYTATAATEMVSLIEWVTVYNDFDGNDVLFFADEVQKIHATTYKETKPIFPKKRVSFDRF